MWPQLLACLHSYSQFNTLGNIEGFYFVLRWQTCGNTQTEGGSVAHPLSESRDVRESIGKRGKDRVRRDFWELSEGRGGLSSLKRERRIGKT